MPAKKAKKTKAQLDEERLIREEEERKAKEILAKKQAEDAEKQRLEDLRIDSERKAFREAELERLTQEYTVYLDDLECRRVQMQAEESIEVSKFCNYILTLTFDSSDRKTIMGKLSKSNGRTESKK